MLSVTEYSNKFLSVSFVISVYCTQALPKQTILIASLPNRRDIMHAPVFHTNIIVFEIWRVNFHFPFQFPIFFRRVEIVATLSSELNIFIKKKEATNFWEIFFKSD